MQALQTPAVLLLCSPLLFFLSWLRLISASYFCEISHYSSFIFSWPHLWHFNSSTCGRVRSHLTLQTGKFLSDAPGLPNCYKYRSIDFFTSLLTLPALGSDCQLREDRYPSLQYYILVSRAVPSTQEWLSKYLQNWLHSPTGHS